MPRPGSREGSGSPIPSPLAGAAPAAPPPAVEPAAGPGPGAPWPTVEPAAGPGPGAASAALVPVAGPVDLGGSLDVFRRSGDDLLDRWDGRVWLRCLDVDGRTVAVAARPAGTVAEPALVVEAEAGADAAAAGRVLAGGFVTAPEALADLAAADPVVARIAARFPGVGPVLQPDLLTAVVRSISAQQITLRFAATLRARLARRYGRRHHVRVPPPPAGPTGRVDTRERPIPGSATLPHRGAAPRVGSVEAAPGAGSEAAPGVGSVEAAPTAEVWSLDPDRLARVEVADLRELQLSTAKARAVVAFARAVAAGRLGLAELARLEDEEVVARLVVFPGIGRWTAEWLLARTLGRPRVVAGDLGVRKAVGAAYLGGRMPSEAEVRAVTAHWGPAAGVAQQLLLHWLSVDAPTGSRSAARPARSPPRG